VKVSSSSQRRRSTNSRRKYPKWAMGPPKHVNPNLRNTARTSSAVFARVRYGEEIPFSINCQFFRLKGSCRRTISAKGREPKFPLATAKLLGIRRGCRRCRGHIASEQSQKPFARCSAGAYRLPVNDEPRHRARRSSGGEGYS
jgi:hypothetical protein